ncbi:MAG: hypothetical protein RI894_1386 [Bacteroidota bacterium]|jgi:ATP-dependent DNA helicase RecQ
MQEDIIKSVLQGNDTLALLPTGGGKSICFQVPALCREGVCIVISPLIALMKDQVHNLRKRNIDAEAIYSGIAYRDIDRILDNCVFGKVKFLYLSPERLQSELVRTRLGRMNVCLLAIDEAHCISQWGYDFRPPYLQIAEIRPLLQKTPVLALTATATPEVVTDIQDKLQFKRRNSENIFQQSFVRDNLAYVVRECEEKTENARDILLKMKGSSVVYVRNRKETLLTAQYLQSYGISVAHYHAGLSAKERSAAQESWINGRVRVIVATNAFGMGIDKPDVQTVIHLDVPETIEAYFQEAGRAGRDGNKAFPILLYSVHDRPKLEQKYLLSYPSLPEIRRVYQALGNYFQLAIGSGEGEKFDFDIAEFTVRYEFNLLKTYNALKILESAGWVMLSESVFKPATIQINVNKEEWYNAVLKYPNLETVMKVLLRAYDNIWHHPAEVDEGKIADYLKMPYAKVRQQLSFLQQQQIIRYSPKNDSPQLLFVRERVSLENLNLTEAAYEFRKQRHYDKMQAMLRYCETNRCRSGQLIAYFGEENTRKCGNCDVCLHEKRALRQHANYEAVNQRLLELLRENQLDMDMLLSFFSPSQQDLATKLFTYYLEEGTICETDDGILQWIV